MNVNDFLMMFAIAAYLMGMLGIGLYFSRKNNDARDFYLGGRSLGPFVTANERRGIRYEQLAPNGSSGGSISHGSRKCGLDGNRSCDRDLYKLASHSQENTNLLASIACYYFT